jgi:hypothetical protein
MRFGYQVCRASAPHPRQQQRLTCLSFCATWANSIADVPIPERQVWRPPVASFLQLDPPCRMVSPLSCVTAPFCRSQPAKVRLYGRWAKITASPAGTERSSQTAGLRECRHVLEIAISLTVPLPSLVAKAPPDRAGNTAERLPQPTFLRGQSWVLTNTAQSLSAAHAASVNRSGDTNRLTKMSAAKRQSAIRAGIATHGRALCSDCTAGRGFPRRSSLGRSHSRKDGGV